MTLTATVSYAGYSASREFAVTVVQDITDQEKVDDALAAVVIHDQNAVRGNITLPTTGARDVALSPGPPRTPTSSRRPVRSPAPPYGVGRGQGPPQRTRDQGYGQRRTQLHPDRPPAAEEGSRSRATCSPTSPARAPPTASRSTSPRAAATTRSTGDELNGGRPVLTSTARRQGRARPVHHPHPRGRQVLPDRHRPEDLRQRRLGRRAAHRQQVHRGLGVDRPGELVRSSAW